MGLGERPFATPCEFRDGRQQRSGYEQAKAKLRRIESDEVAIAFGPPA